jgi:hypothetical protein
MEQQDNSSTSKAKSTTKDLKNCEKEEISNIEFQKLIERKTMRSKKRHKN